MAKESRVLKLTEERIRKLPLGSGIWRDSEVRGLLCICHKECRTYSVQTDLRRPRRHVRTIRKKLDRCDRIGLADVRRRAKTLLGQIQGGVDPFARTDETGITLKQALDEHLKGRNLRPRTRESYQGHLDGYLKRFRSRAVADIGRQDVRELLDELTERHGRTACSSGLRTLRV
jgi:hypothetical protein